MAGVGESEEWGYYLIGMEFQFYKMKRLMERDGRAGCTKLRMDLIPLNGTLRMIKGGKFYVMCILPQKVAEG